jgi:translocator protein
MALSRTHTALPERNGAGPVTPGTKRGRLLGLLVFLVIVFAASAIGSVFTSMGQPEWYDTLRKPDWTPAGWLFGPVWTALFLAMAIAAWRVWTRTGWAGLRGPLGLFFGQLALNVGWSGIFFGMRMPGLAFFEIVLLAVAIAATLVAFWRVSRLAGWLMVPYLLWVLFASALNLSIWQLNA